MILYMQQNLEVSIKYFFFIRERDNFLVVVILSIYGLHIFYVLN